MAIQHASGVPAAARPKAIAFAPYKRTRTLNPAPVR
jgi:hypothetical protein